MRVEQDACAPSPPRLEPPVPATVGSWTAEARTPSPNSSSSVSSVEPAPLCSRVSFKQATSGRSGCASACSAPPTSCLWGIVERIYSVRGHFLAAAKDEAGRDAAFYAAIRPEMDALLDKALAPLARVHLLFGVNSRTGKAADKLFNGLYGVTTEVSNDEPEYDVVMGHIADIANVADEFAESVRLRVGAPRWRRGFRG
jgi:hypothetical protein